MKWQSMTWRNMQMIGWKSWSKKWMSLWNTIILKISKLSLPIQWKGTRQLYSRWKTSSITRMGSYITTFHSRYMSNYVRHLTSSWALVRRTGCWTIRMPRVIIWIAMWCELNRMRKWIWESWEYSLKSRSNHYWSNLHSWALRNLRQRRILLSQNIGRVYRGPVHREIKKVRKSRRVTIFMMVRETHPRQQRSTW